jgi:hypothetical protein
MPGFFGAYSGHCTWTNVQSGIFPPTSKQVVVQERDCTWVDFGRSRGNCIWVYLGCSWIVRSDSNCQGFLPKQKILVHHQCSKCNCHVQGLSLCSRSQTQQLHHHMESWTCCYLSVCTRNFTLHINSFWSTPVFIRDSTE